MKREKSVLVDKHDNVIGYKFRDEIDYSNDIYRSTGIWITNSKGQVLIAKRSQAKKNDPGKWGPAAAGTVEEGETYEEDATKEAAEELGLKNISLSKGPKQYFDKPRRQFYQWFLALIDKPADEFVIQKEEVERVEWIDRDELVRDQKEHPEKYIPFMGEVLRVLI